MEKQDIAGGDMGLFEGKGGLRMLAPALVDRSKTYRSNSKARSRARVPWPKPVT